VAALVAGAGRVYPVGRLDLKSTGLLLLTNDGALAAGLLHPRGAVTRVYHVKVDGTPSEEAITRLRRGVRLADGKTVPAHVRVLERLPTKTWLQVTVVEGRTHLVRRMCEAVGHRVDKLARVRFGPVALGTLPPGAWRDVTPRELAALRAAAGLRPGGGARHRHAERATRGPEDRDRDRDHPRQAERMVDRPPRRERAREGRVHPQATETMTAVASAMRAAAAACPKPPTRRRSTTKRTPKLPSATAEVASASPTCPKPSRRTKSQLRA